MQITTTKTRGSMLASTIAALAIACTAPAAFAQSETSSESQQQSMQSDTNSGMQADDAAMNAPKSKDSKIRSNDTSAKAIAERDAKEAKARVREQGLYDQPKEEEEESGTP